MNSGEGLSSDQIAKVPRVLKSGIIPRKRNTSKDFREKHTQQVNNSEHKIKTTLLRFYKGFKDLETCRNKLYSTQEQLVKLREELIEKGVNDIPNLPDILAWIKKSSPKSLPNLLNHNNCFNYDTMLSKEFSEEKKDYLSTLKTISSDKIVVEKNLKNIEDALTAAYEKQNILEANMETYRKEISYVIDNYQNQNIESIKTNSEQLIKEMEIIKEELNSERSKSINKLNEQNEIINTLNESWENEQSKRRTIEENLLRVEKEKNELRVECEKYKKQLEKSKAMEIQSNSGCNKDLADQTEQKYETVDLNNKLAIAQCKISSLHEENKNCKNEIRKLVNEKEEIRNEYLNHCQEVLFQKQDQIYAIKCKMDLIANLKNAITSQDNRDSNINVTNTHILAINDKDSLKKEVVSLVNKVMALEESIYEMEKKLSTKDVQIQGLQDELQEKSMYLQKVENLIEYMKIKDESTDLLESLITMPTLFQDKDLTGNNQEHEDKVQELAIWYEKKRQQILEFDKIIKSSEKRYSFAEERRIRNEERIAQLQIKLAKFQYYK